MQLRASVRPEIHERRVIEAGCFGVQSVANRATCLCGRSWGTSEPGDDTVTATTKLAERVGQLLKGRYRVDHVLHVGARSTVYAGVDHKSGRVAIKVLDTQPDASVLRGSYLANAVGHPSAVNVLDTGTTDDGATFLVMELLEGTSMRELLAQHEGHLPVRLACNIADQGLDLLASAHAQRIAHGEISLDKLFFARAERVKLLGFGKPANEQAVADDVRALSKVVALLLGGEAVASIQTPPRIAAVIERGRSADPAEQWKSARAMRAALQLACQAELGRPIDFAWQPTAARKVARRPKRGLWIAAAAAIVVGLFVSREVRQLGQEQAPEAAPHTDIAAALQPAQAKAQGGEEATPKAEEQAEPSAPARVPEREVSESEPEPTRAVPRKPNRADLRLPIQRKTGLPTNIAPLHQLCAQLTSTRRSRPLSDHEAQLYTDRCTKR